MPLKGCVQGVTTWHTLHVMQQDRHLDPGIDNKVSSKVFYQQPISLLPWYTLLLFQVYVFCILIKWYGCWLMLFQALAQVIGHWSALSNVNAVTHHTLSSFDYECSSCHAAHFLEERKACSRLGSPNFSKCCFNGKVTLRKIQDPSLQLFELFTSQSVCKLFLDVIY